MFWKSRLRRFLHQFRSPATVANRHHADDFVQLYIDRLEDRRVLSVSVNLLAGGVLEILSDGDSDTVSIELDAAGSGVETLRIFDDTTLRTELFHDATNTPINTADLTAIQINLGDGTDVLNFQVPTGSNPAKLPIDIEGGFGDDTVHIIDNPAVDPFAENAALEVTAETITFADNPAGLDGSLNYGNVDFVLNGTLSGSSSLTLSTAGSFEMHGDISNGANAIDLNIGETLTLDGDVTSSADVSISATSIIIDGDVQIDGDNILLDGPFTADTDLDAESLTVTGTNNVTINDSVSGLDDVIINAGTGIELHDDIMVNDLLELNDDLSLADDLTLTSTTNTIMIDGGVDGPFALTLSAANGTDVSGAIGTDTTDVVVNAGSLTAGSIDILGSLTANAGLMTDVGGITVGMNLAAALGVTSNGGIAVTGNSTLGGTTQSNGTQTYSGPLALVDNSILTSTGDGSIGLSTVTGNAHDLSINTGGITQLNGNVNGVGTLQTNAGGTTQIGATSLSGTSFQFDDSVELLTSTTFNASGTAEAVVFNDTLAGGGFGLNVTGGVEFNAAASGLGLLETDQLDSDTSLSAASLTVSGASNIGGAVVTSGAISLQGVTLTDNATLTSGDTLSLQSVDGDVNLTLSATNDTTVSGAFGNTINDLNVMAGNLFAATIDIDGTLTTTNSSVTTTGSLSAGAIDVGGDLDVGGALESELNGIEISGMLHAVSTVISAGTLNVTGAAVLCDDVVAVDTIDFGDTVTLTETITVTSQAGDVAFSGAINSDNSGTYGLTVNAAGTAEFSAEIGTGTDGILQALTVNADDIHVLENVTTESNIDLTASTVNIQQTLTTTVDGAVMLDNSGELNIGNDAEYLLEGAFLQTGAGAVALGGNITTTGDAATFTGVVTLTDSVMIHTAGGAVTFNASVNGTSECTESLTIDAGSAGDVSLNGTVGDSTGLNDILITNAHDVTVSQQVRASSLSQTTGSGTTSLNGPVTLKGGDLELHTNDIAINGMVDAGDTGAVRLDADHNIVVNSTITTNSGLVSLESGATSSFTASAEVLSTTGSVTVDAETLTMADQSTIDAGSGTIALLSSQDLTLGTVTTTNATNDAVAITATTGAIIDAGTTGSNVVAESGQLTLSAATGIGDGDPLEIAVNTLQVINSTSGNVELVEATAVTILGMANEGSGGINLSTEDGALTVADSGTGISTMSGNVDLAAAGTDGNILINANISTAGGALDLTATRSVTSTAGDDLSTVGTGIDSGAITIQAGTILSLSGDVDSSNAGTNAGGTVELTTTDGAITVTNVTTSSTSGIAGDLTITAGDADASVDSDITLLGALTATGGTSATTTLTASGGDIIDGNDGATTIATGDLTLVAHENIGTIDSLTDKTGDAIDVDVQGAVTSLTTGTAGDINLQSSQTLVFAAGSIDPGSGNSANLLLQTAGDLDLGDAALADVTGDNISLCADGLLTLPDGGVDVGTGTLAFVAADIVDPSGSEIGKLIADDLQVTTTNSTESLTLNTDVNTLSVDFTAVDSSLSLTVNECNSVIVQQVTSHGSDVTINAALEDPGNITIEQIDAGAGVVTLDVTTNGGQVIDGSEATTDVIASALAIQATTGIGNTDKLEVEVDTLAATTISGDIRIVDETDGVTIDEVNGVSGLSITAGEVGSDIEVNAHGPLVVESGVSNVGGGDITLAADGEATDSDLQLNATVSASGGDGNLTLFAGDSMMIDDGILISAEGAGEVTLRAGVDFQNGAGLIDGNGSGNVTMGDGSTLQSDAGNVVVRASGNVAVSIIDTNANIVVSADDAGVSGTASDGIGEITDALTAETANLIGVSATLSAATGIGAADDINTDLNTISLSNSTSGNINITEVANGGGNSLEVSSVTNVGGNVNVQTNDGTLTLSGPLSTTGSGTVDLTAGDVGGSGDDMLIIEGPITTEDGLVSLTSTGSDITLNADGDITTQQGAITLSAGQDSGAGAIVQAAESVIDAGDATIMLAAQAEIVLGTLQTNSTADDAVTIKSTASVASADSSLTNINAAMGRLVIESESGVGPLNTEIESLDVLSNTGSVIITEANALDVIRVADTDAATPLTVDLSAGGTLTLVNPGDGIDAAAVTLQTTETDADVVVNSQVTATDELNITSQNDVVLGDVSSLSAAVLAVEAVGSVTMEDGSVVDVTGGTATFTAGNDITVSQVTADSIQLVAGGAIIDADADMGPDLIATSLQMAAANGIGTGNPLETQVETLEVVNTSSGNIEIDNATGDLLTLNGITNFGNGGGSISITNQGAIDVNNAVTNLSGGALELAAIANGGEDDHLTVNAPITATGDNADITLTAGTDLIINDTGVSDDISGKSVTGIASRTIDIADTGVIVRSSTGSVTKATPDLENVVTPQVLTTGIAVIQGEFGDVDNNNFIFQILWDPEGPVQDTYASGDPIFNNAAGTNIGITPGIGPGTFAFDHRYFANPNENSPSADIPITITLFDDPNITFIENGVDLGQTSVTSLAPVPGEGISGGIVFDLSIEVPQLEAPRVQFGSTTDTGNEEFVAAEETLEVQTVLDIDSVQDERMVLIQKIGPDGQVEVGADGNPIQQTLYGDEAQAVLDDLPGVFEKLDEGHWRIYLKEGGDAQQQLVRDVVLREGRPATENTGTQDRPPTDDNEMMPANRVKERPPMEGLDAPVMPDTQRPAAPRLPEPLSPAASQSQPATLPVAMSLATAAFAIPHRTASRVTKKIGAWVFAAKNRLTSFL